MSDPRIDPPSPAEILERLAEQFNGRPIGLWTDAEAIALRAGAAALRGAAVPSEEKNDDGAGLAVEIERALDTIDRESFMVDYSVIGRGSGGQGVVVELSTAKHAILFIRRVLHASAPPPSGSDGTVEQARENVYNRLSGDLIEGLQAIDALIAAVRASAPAVSERTEDEGAICGHCDQPREIFYTTDDDVDLCEGCYLGLREEMTVRNLSPLPAAPPETGTP